MQKNITQKFGEFLADTSFTAIPDNAVLAAKKIMADSFGVIVGGVAEADIQAMIHQMQCMENGEATILGTSLRADMMTASLINGTAGTVLEMDEGHQFAKGHPGMHILPALLAYSEVNPISTEDFLKAFILGYDVAARIGLASSLSPKMHPHGTWGGIGAAAALGVAEKLDATAMSNLLNIASSLTLATSRKTMLEGGTVRNAYTGVANQMAHLSLSLLKSGFSGEQDGINSVFGGVVSSRFDHDLAFDELGTRLEVCRNYFKLHACCRYNHAALDALHNLMEKHESLANLGDIRSITVESYNLAAELEDPKPRNVLACKFSIPFAIATTLFHRSSDVLSFTEEARQHPEIQALCQKVTIVENTSMTAQLPDFRPASVRVEMADGQRFETQVKTNRGDWQDPYQEDDLKNKFMSLTARRWPESKSNEIYQMLMHLNQHDLSAIFLRMTQD